MSSPPKGATWMQDNLSWLKDYPIGKVLCLPGSHDAGMDKMSTNSFAIGKDMIIAQTRDIYGQLTCGIRWFDIRPYIKGSEWYCGHFSYAETIDWQGGTGQKINEVIENVNRFTRQNKELIVLRLTYGANIDAGRKLTAVEQTDILRTFLDKLEHVRKPNEYENVLEKKLDQYVGTSQCVIVATRMNDEAGNRIEDQAWERLGRKITDYRQDIESLFCMRDEAAAELTGSIGSLTMILVGPSGYFDRGYPIVLNMTAELQNKCFTALPQALVSRSGGVDLDAKGVIFQADNNCDDVALNTCLAASQVQWLTAKNGNKPNQCIVVYGGQLITNQDILTDLVGKISGRKKFKIENALFKGMDPWPGTRKSCCIYYSESRQEKTGEGLFWKGRFAREGDEIDFATDINEIQWHDTYLKGRRFRQAYTIFIAALLARIPIRLDFDKMPFLLPDPAAGVKKKMVIKYRSWSALMDKKRNIWEGRTYDLGRDIDWIRWGSWIVDNADVYPQFFDCIDDQKANSLRVTNQLFNGYDPDVGKRKEASMALRKGPGTEREEMCREDRLWDVFRLL